MAEEIVLVEVEAVFVGFAVFNHEVLISRTSNVSCIGGISSNSPSWVPERVLSVVTRFSTASIVDRNLGVGNSIEYRLRIRFDVFTPLYRIRSRRYERERLGDDIR